MSKNSKEEEKNTKKKGGSRMLPLELKEETKYMIYAIVFFVITLLFILASFGGSGRVGRALHDLGTLIFGYGYFLLPTTTLLIGASFLQTEKQALPLRNIIGSILFLVSSFGIAETLSSAGHFGGLLGLVIAKPFMYLFGYGTAILVLLAILLISMLIMFDTRPNLVGVFERIRAWINAKKEGYEEARTRRREERLVEEASRPQEEPEEQVEAEVEAPPISQKEIEAVVEEIDEELNEQKTTKRKVLSSYSLPPISLLEKDRGKPNTGDVKANAQIIKLTLQNFGIDVEMDEITVGPTVTRYALKPAQGVKLSRILSLQNDLSLSLAAHPIRIEAPIPGKSLVGIEIPNKAKSIIGFASLMGDEAFQKNPKPLMVALGKNVAGKAIYTNLAKMPHGLIAGATGSGKSVTIHAIITSLLYRNTPEHLRFIFVDPKRVELTLYNKIPHLLTPVITDAKKAILALKWAAKEMDRRYDILEKEAVRDIESYHKNVVDPFYAKKQKDEDKGPDKMPYIVIVIDELADIMQAYPRELESAIVRLAQMSRAVGIHLILSTQRPSVNVITGLIKANIPARIALKVASQIDSRTILDSPGAEELIGQGDMLYLSGEMANAERIQCAYISEEEVKKVVKYISEENVTEIPEDITQQKDALAADNSIFNASLEPSDHDDDDMYEQARQVVIETQKASTSFLQRKLGVGYARAARLIDQLEERGIVGPGNGAKPREVLEKGVTHEETTF